VVARSLCWTLPEPGFPAQACLSLSSSTERFGYSSVLSGSQNTFTIGGEARVAVVQARP
jgi:hypothetical protein